MIHLHAGVQGTLVSFTLSPEDRKKYHNHEPYQVSLDIDPEYGSFPVEALCNRWLLIASMLTGLTEAQVLAETFSVRRYPYGPEDEIPVPSGTVFLRADGGF